MQERTDNYGSVIARVGVGTAIQTDDYPFGRLLKPGLAGFCDYYLAISSEGPIKEVAVNVEVTGRTRQHRAGGWYVRARITFVGDGVPDEIKKGWVPAVWD